MSDCIFCRIIAGEIPALKVYEDGDVVAFLDAQPVNAGHTLVVPRAHYPDLSETPDDVVAAIFRAAKRIARAALRATGAPAYNIGVNIGSAAGQVVMHTHVHVMPRFENDGHRHWSKRPVADAESRTVADRMREALQ